jgi:hypothetical protein
MLTAIMNAIEFIIPIFYILFDAYYRFVAGE